MEEYEMPCVELFAFINLIILNVIQEKWCVLCYRFQIHGYLISKRDNVHGI